MRFFDRTSERREFVPPDVRPEQLVGAYDEMSVAAARELTEPYRGQWLRVRGQLADAVLLQRNLALARFARGPAASPDDPAVRIEMYFRSRSIEQLVGRDRGEAVVIGQIMEISQSQIVLDFCEIEADGASDRGGPVT